MRADKSCWTCKQRKIGCDRSIPHCSNCVRTRRACEGYGTRLSWPDQLRSRQKDHIVCAVVETAGIVKNSRSDTPRFLNATLRDFRLASERRLMWNQIMDHASPGPSASLALHPPLVDDDGMLLAYYEHTIAPMCSTTRASNGFRCHIIPMVLSSRDEPTQALCNAILAIAAHHRRGAVAASTYKMRAIRGLYKTLDSSSRNAEMHLATIMMLCMYTVFDEHEAQFTLHLNGAKKILMSLTPRQRQHPVMKFLMGWMVYYDTLRGFAQPSRGALDEVDRFELTQELQPDSCEVAGLFGCSIGVFDAISIINKIRNMILRSKGSGAESSLVQLRMVVHEKLRNMRHFLGPEEVASSTSDQIRDAKATAELYRLASLLCLQRVVPAAGDEKKRSGYLEQAFAALNRARVATSPWPVFMVACEAHSEEQRSYILDVLDRMDRVRNVGNIRVMRTVIEKIWVQQDLREPVEETGTVPWWLCIEADLPVPWFA